MHILLLFFMIDYYIEFNYFLFNFFSLYFISVVENISLILHYIIIIFTNYIILYIFTYSKKY